MLCKTITSLEQSEKLIELGIDPKSADCYYDKGTKIPYISLSGGIPCDLAIPAWSVTALLELMPAELDDDYFLTIDKESYKEFDEYCCCYQDCNGNSFHHFFGKNPIDAVVDMIVWLKENNKLEL